MNDPLVFVLAGSALLAIALGELTDGLVVAAVVVLNSLIGFFREYRASRAIEALHAAGAAWTITGDPTEAALVVAAQVGVGSAVVAAALIAFSRLIPGD